MYDIKAFNPRSREGNDWASPDCTSHSKAFQSTFPRGERPQRRRTRIHTTSFQSTFPRGERRTYPDPIADHGTFNPRSREGNDRFWDIGLYSPCFFQSTFPRGERRCSYLALISNLFFQSTFPRGERPVRNAYIFGTAYFQSTFPRGERHYRLLQTNYHLPFNPRSREGNDKTAGFWQRIAALSIHVPARGTTKMWTKWFKSIRTFNPRSREGNDSNFSQITFMFSSLISIIIPIQTCLLQVCIFFFSSFSKFYSANLPQQL